MQQGWEQVPQLERTQKRARRVRAPARSVRPQRMVDMTEGLGDTLSVSSFQFRLYFNSGDGQHLEVVAGYSV